MNPRSRITHHASGFTGGLMFHNRMRPVRIFLIFILFAGFVFSLPPNRAGLAQNSDAPPYSWPRSHNYDVQHYRINLSFDWAKQSVSGETTITFQPLTPDIREVEIDAGDMTIKAVKLADGAQLKYRYVGDEKLYVALDRAYPAGQNVSIAINYEATPKDGLTFLTPNESDPTRPHQIWSQGEGL